MSNRAGPRPTGPSRREPDEAGREHRAEDALRRSERRRLLAAEVADVGDYDIDLATGKVEWGGRALAMMRLGPGAEPTLADYYRLIHPDDRDRVRAVIERAAAPDGDGRFRAEFRFLFPDGEVRWLDSRGRADPEEAGGMAAHVLGAMVDVTGRMRVEAELQASERSREVALAGGRMGAWRWDLREQLVRGDAAFLSLWGVPPSDAPLPLGLFTDRMSAEGAAAMGAMISRAVAAGEEFDGEVEVVAGPAAGRWVRWRGRAESGSPWILNGVSFDSTETRRARIDLRASEERFRALVTATSYVIYRMSPDWSEMRRLDGRGFLADVIAPTSAWLEDYILPDDRPRVLAAVREAIRGRELFEMEHRVLRADGAVGWTLSRAVPLLGHDGEVVEWFGAAADVSERKAAEEALRGSEGRLRAVAANLPYAAVFVVGPDLRYLLVEGHALRAAGFSPPDLEGKTVAETVGPALAPDYEANYRRALAGEEVTVEHSSHGRHYITHLVPLPGPEGRTAAALAVSYDITDRARAEEEVRQARDGLERRVAERTAELEQEIGRRKDLARRLSTAQEDERRRASRDLHDSVGQLLAALPIALRAVERAGRLDPAAAASLMQARLLTDAVSREVHALAVRLRPTALDDLGLEVALEQLAAEWSARTGVRADFQATGIAGGRLPAEVETAVYRVVQEALTNVAKHARAAAVSVVVSRPDGHVTAVVEDDGSGFAPDAVPRGRLGLLGMRERVALVGGELNVESAPGSGTAILIRIPLPGSGAA